MKKAVLFPMVFAVIGIASAALPPQYQNMKDLDVMVEYVREHPEAAAGLRLIDLGALTLYYGYNCKVRPSSAEKRLPSRRAGWGRQTPWS